jgi:5-oxoprolinase (ATP-hydrolysing)
VKQRCEEDGDAAEGDSQNTREINIGGKATIHMGKGDRLRIETPGGGGWGLPTERESPQGDAVEPVKEWTTRGSLAEREAVQRGF